MDLSRIGKYWQAFEDKLIASAGQAATIYYFTYMTGTGPSYDSHFKESFDPTRPDDFGDVSAVSGAPQTLPGIVYPNLFSVSNDDPILVTAVGRYEPDTVVFKCRLSDAIISGINLFDNSKYVILSTDSDRRFEVLGYQRDGLSGPYVLYVFLGRSSVAL